jgi:hypothetical protein
VPHTARYAHAYAALRGRRRCYEKVLLTDTRDVYFQSDVFEHVTRQALYVTQEQVRAGATADCCYVQTNSFNRQWLEDVDRSLDHVGDAGGLFSGGVRMGTAVGGGSPQPPPRLSAAQRVEAKYGGRTPILNSGITMGTTDAVALYLKYFVLAMSRMRPPIRAGKGAAGGSEGPWDGSPPPTILYRTYNTYQKST